MLLDGAHNDPGVRALCGYLDRWMPKENTVLISAMMRDKETEKMCQRLAPRVRCVVCTQPNIPRAMPADELAKEFEAQGLRAYARTHVKDALEEARRLAGPEGNVVCAGSLYLIGEMENGAEGRKGQAMNFEHVSVMLMPTVDMLNVREGGIYVDGTLGGGGHSAEILRRLNGTGHLYGIDRDNDALAAATERLGAAGNFTAVKGNFHDVKALLAARGVTKIDGMMIDLGVSSYQLDTAERGFSYHADAPLDMRMDQDQALTAREIVNTWSAEDIARILREYSEEKWAVRIAQIICEHRAQKPLETTGDLVACVDAAIPKKVRMQDNGHSARRTFQALRIAVNDELDPLKKALEDMTDLLNPGGRLAVLTFHSLE
ncbi:MAG: 16S rRNA (cytosine(1402)-N(4))-methyltransferase RsmH, partial [Christensenellales bacterium]